MSLPDFFFDRVTAEVRQQMEGVLALSEQLSRQRLTPDGEACIASVADAAAAVTRLLDTATDLRTVAFSGLIIDEQPVRLRDLMDEIQSGWQARAETTGVTLLVSYDGDPDAAAMADRRRLLQIFDGFIGEAVASQGRGAVEAGLHVFSEPAGVRLEGRIRGPRATAWDAEDHLTRMRIIQERLGLEIALGTMLASRVLQGMGGARSNEVGTGTSDTVSFEIVLAHVPDQISAPIETPGRAAHILVVDDNATNRMVAQSLVEMFDCTSESADDGEAAVEAARSGRFDLILMDIRMPLMDGVAATRAIRSFSGTAGAVPIIALTANADPDDAAAYLAAGMNGVVEKPMKPEQLLAALQDALDPQCDAAAA